MDTDDTKQFADFLRHSGQEGVLVLDNKGNVLSANWTAESLLGYGVGQLTNIHVSEPVSYTHLTLPTSDLV